MAIGAEIHHMHTDLSARNVETARHDAPGIARSMRFGLFEPGGVEAPASRQCRRDDPVPVRLEPIRRSAYPHGPGGSSNGKREDQPAFARRRARRFSAGLGRPSNGATPPFLAYRDRFGDGPRHCAEPRRNFARRARFRLSTRSGK